ncbi:MAG: rRNA maturation RNase YbeY [Propionibacteriaceae bacterium]|jgi:probable rRNA maturation factor|nr:rRNA maturation RNase YbeY [Propionibacteriaceae bacterium]
MIDINNESGESVDEQALVRLADFTLRQMRIHPQVEVSILLVDEAAMTGYHERFMGEPGPTDVLSFPMDELHPGPAGGLSPEGILGDVVICPAFAAKQAATNGRSVAGEIQYILVHGLLHLMGYDHAVPEDKRVMFGLNDRLIRDWLASRA